MRALRGTAIAALVAATVLASTTPASGQDEGFEPFVTGLDFAVNLAVLPDGRILVAEKASGRIRVVEDGTLRAEPLASLPVDATNNETGLLGLAVDPAFPEEPYIYAYFSDVRDGMNRLVRMRLEGGTVGEPRPLFEAIATTPIHNGGDLAFAEDGTLFLVTGDGAVAPSAQDPDDPRGKVLRFERDGGVPEDNPTPGSPVYALGIRNSFGLCSDPNTGALWETENGPTAWDEVNEIRARANYGWPDHLGPGGAPDFVEPAIAFEQVIVPTGCAFDLGDDALLFGDFGGGLHRLDPAAAGAGADVRDELVATFPDGVTDVAAPIGGDVYVLTTSTIYRATTGGPSTGATGGDATEPPATTTPGGTPPATTPTRPAGDDGGFGTALGTTAGLVVLALFAAAFLWLRSRALRR